MNILKKGVTKICKDYVSPSKCEHFAVVTDKCCHAIRKHNTSEWYCLNRKCYGEYKENKVVRKMIEIAQKNKDEVMSDILHNQLHICSLCNNKDCTMSEWDTDSCLQMLIDNLNEDIKETLKEVMLEGAMNGKM